MAWDRACQIPTHCLLLNPAHSPMLTSPMPARHVSPRHLFCLPSSGFSPSLFLPPKFRFLPLTCSASRVQVSPYHLFCIPIHLSLLDSDKQSKISQLDYAFYTKEYSWNTYVLPSIANPTHLPRLVPATLGCSSTIKIHRLCYSILSPSEQFNQSILISSRLQKSHST